MRHSGVGHSGATVDFACILNAGVLGRSVVYPRKILEFTPLDIDSDTIWIIKFRVGRS